MATKSPTRKKSWKNRSPAILGLPFTTMDILKAVAEAESREGGSEGVLALLSTHLGLVAANIMHVPPTGRILLSDCFGAASYEELSAKISSLSQKLMSDRAKTTQQLLELHDRMLRYEGAR